MQFSVNDLRELAGTLDGIANCVGDLSDHLDASASVSFVGGLLTIQAPLSDGLLAQIAARFGASGSVRDDVAPPVDFALDADADAVVEPAPIGVKPTNFGPPWTEAERDEILRIARAQPDFGSFAIAELVSEGLNRSQKAVDNYIRNNMRTSVQAARKAGVADRRAAERLAFPPVKAPAAKGVVAKAAARQAAYSADEDDRLVAWMVEHPAASTYQCGRALGLKMGRSDRAIDMHLKKILAVRIAQGRAAAVSALAAQKVLADTSVDMVSAAPASAAEVAAAGSGDAPAAVGPDEVLAPVAPFVAPLVAPDAPPDVSDMPRVVPVAPVVQKVLVPVAPAVVSGADADDFQILTRLGRGEKIPMVAADLGMDTAYVGSRFLELVAPFKAKGYGPVDAQRKAIERLSALVGRA